MYCTSTVFTILQERFKDKIGYSRFVEGLKRLGQPSRELLNTVLDMVIEGPYKSGGTYPVCNAQAALMLIQWLPDIQSVELQVRLEQLPFEFIRTSDNFSVCCISFCSPKDLHSFEKVLYCNFLQSMSLVNFTSA